MKFFIYLIYLVIQFGGSQSLWKEIYNSKNWENFTEQQREYPWYCSIQYGCQFSDCGDSKLLGGYSLFGKQAYVQANFKLPAHTSIQITFDFWKIDSWDDEKFAYFIDNQINFSKFVGFQGENICGGYGDYFKDLKSNQTVNLSPHISSSLYFFMSSTLDTYPNEESWGFNNFKIEIEECPEGCVFCQDQAFACNLWINFVSYWSNSYESFGWQTDTSQSLGYGQFGIFSMAGGISNLLKGQYIEKLIQYLPPHFKVHVVVKLWVFGRWNDTFNLEIDNQLKYSAKINSFDSLFQIGIYKVQIFNIDANTYHTSPEIKINMKSVKDLTDIGYWGVSFFDLYLAKCKVGCEECIWNIVYECVRCIKKWGLLNNECTPAPPLQSSFVYINQVFSLNTNSIFQFQLKIDELDLVMNEIGQIQKLVNANISKISIQIMVQCQEGMQISSFFRNCDGCEGEQYSVFHYCPSQNNIFNYDATFIQIVESQKELVFNMSESKIEIIQVSIVNNAEKQVLLLKIEI
ncbi:unnamed protein product (macronuclear) [Paramecium tetraurelia]|uniref:Uncharacterized protein n=1 Tax=Paramecium tetraurelia TaxID=5888 RepID=A0C3A4_PARTE|nr:uncharacterized protein GSPATT00034750001 [Paramecium tetraurelia]CAK65271.1 unnamed protein product [Paramecium tetraurelia]|eukprot:XP_001432668.1 hypothetical protein (macronuclear) [Paramecium tetraurelia strain d4-2]